MAEIDILGLITGWWLLIVILTSSLIVNVMQVFALYITPFLGITDFRTRLGYSQGIANTWWQIFCFMTELWSGIHYVWSGELVKKSDNAILIGNHERGIDFVNGVSVSSRAANVGCGRMMTMMKQSLQYLPIVGFTHTLQGSLFLKRNWTVDQGPINNKLGNIESGNYPHPYWIGIYPEGTRITDVKRSASQSFAETKQLPKLNNVLLPRTKGFTYLLTHLPTSLNAIYDVTAGYNPGGLYLTDVLTTGRFACKSIHLHIERIDINKIEDRTNEEALSTWLIDRFQKKDKLLETFNKQGKFDADELVYPTQSALHTRYRLVFFTWSLAVIFLFRLFLGSTLLVVLQLALTGATMYKSFLGKQMHDPNNRRNYIPATGVVGDEQPSRNEAFDDGDDPESVLEKEYEDSENLRKMTEMSRQYSGNRFADEIKARKTSVGNQKD